MSLFKKKETEKNELSLSALEKDVDRLFIVQDVIKSLSTISTQEDLYVEILNAVEQRMGYSSASVSLVDIEQDYIQLKYFSDSFLTKLLKGMFLGPKSLSPISIANTPMSLTKKAAIEQKVYIDRDMTKFIVPPISQNMASIIQGVSRAKCMIALPIKTPEKVVAVINFTVPRSPEEIRENEMKALESMVAQIGLLIDNIIKYEKISNFNTTLKTEVDIATADLRKQNKDLASLFNLSSNIAKSLDPVEVAQIAANALPQDDTMVGAIITNYSEMSNTINVQAVSQNAISNAAKQILGDFSKYVLELSNENARLSPTGRAIIQERPVFTNDIAAAFDPPIPKKFLKPIEKLLGIKSIAVYPVIARGELKGTVGFLLKQHLAEEVTDAQKQLFQTYTSQIAIALENAKLFETSQRIQASLESALKELKEAREKERDMIDIMGHELRTPMSIVRNSLGMMEMHLKQKGKIPEDKQQKYVDTALESAKREINLIETLLSATKADSKGFDLTLEKIDFNDVVNDSVEAFSKQAEKKGLTLTVNKPQMPIYVYADRTRAQEIADNFIGNAVKYTPSGSVTITVEQKGDDAWITIADTGYGISEEDLQKLGHKFFRARQHTNEVSSSEEITNTKVPNQANSPAEEKVAAIIRPGGTGLGLYVSFSLIYIMGGKLIVESTLGQGSIFSFALPIYKDQKLDQDQKQVDGNNLPIRITGNKLTIN